MPHYLSWKSRQLGYEPRMIALADEVNEGMPAHIVDLVERALSTRGLSLKGARVLMLGITYKPNVSDTRVSPPMQILQGLAARGADVAYHDPLAPVFDIDGERYVSIDLDASTLATADCVVIATNHASYDWEHVARSVSLLVDTRNATANLSAEAIAGTRIVRLGTPMKDSN